MQQFVLRQDWLLCRDKRMLKYHFCMSQTFRLSYTNPVNSFLLLILDNNNNLMDSIVENNLLLSIDFQLKIDGEKRNGLSEARN